MTLKQLEYFYHLCGEPHIINTARKLGVSQPAISLSIKALEEELQEQLFSRIGKKLVLNERGRLFKDQTYQHFVALKDARSMFHWDSLAGKLSIAASKTFNTYLLPGILFDFQLQFPKVNIKKISDNSTHILNGVREGKYDAGFVESCFDDPYLIKEKIGEDELIVVTGDSLLASKKRYIDSVFDRHWILREAGSGTRDVFLDKLAEIGLKPDIFLELPEFDEIKNILLSNKRTLSCISRLAVHSEMERGELFEVELNNLSFTRELFVVYHKNRFKTLLFGKFIDFVKERFSFK